MPWSKKTSQYIQVSKRFYVSNKVLQTFTSKHETGFIVYPFLVVQMLDTLLVHRPKTYCHWQYRTSKKAVHPTMENKTKIKESNRNGDNESQKCNFL